MRISDWSSDVCSSDLKFAAIAAAIAVLAWLFVPWLTWPLIILTVWVLAFFRDPVRVTPRDENLIIALADGLVTLIKNRSEERRVGEKGGSTCRSRWSPDH